MDVVRIYAGDDGESYLEDVTLDLVTKSVPGFSSASSALWPVSNLEFRAVDDDFESGYHVAPRRQLVVNLIGTSEIEVSSGEVRDMGPGTVMLVEDLTGKGHKAAKKNGEPLHMLLIHLA